MHTSSQTTEQTFPRTCHTLPPCYTPPPPPPQDRMVLWWRATARPHPTPPPPPPAFCATGGCCTNIAWDQTDYVRSTHMRAGCLILSLSTIRHAWRAFCLLHMPVPRARPPPCHTAPLFSSRAHRAYRIRLAPHLPLPSPSASHYFAILLRCRTPAAGFHAGEDTHMPAVGT